MTQAKQYLNRPGGKHRWRWGGFRLATHIHTHSNMSVTMFVLARRLRAARNKRSFLTKQPSQCLFAHSHLCCMPHGIKGEKVILPNLICVTEIFQTSL